MKLALLDLLERKEAVYDENCDVEGLGKKTELAMHVDNPFYEESTASVFDFRRELNFTKVVRAHLELLLLLPHVAIDLICHLRDILRVPHIELVLKYHVFANCASELRNSLLKNLSHWFLRCLLD